MADYEWPDDLAPYAQSFYLQPHVVRSESPFSRQQKVYGLSAPRWVTRMSFRGGYDGIDSMGAYGPRLDALLAKLNGGTNRVAIYDFRRSELRSAAATVNVGAQAALLGSTSLTLVGLRPGENVYAGDYVGGDGRPHIITDNATADASGRAVVSVQPPFAANVTAGNVVVGNPTGWFRVTSDDAGDNGVEVGNVAQYTVEFVEDLSDLAGYNPQSEFVGGVDGAMYDLAQWETTLFQDTAKETPVTASGDMVKCVANVLGDEDWDLIVADDAKRPQFLIVDGVPRLRAADGDGVYFRAQRTCPIPAYLFTMMSFTEANVNASFGLLNNSGDKFHLGATSTLSRVQVTIASPTLSRAQVVAQTPFYVARPNVPVAVDSLATAGEVDTVANGGPEDPTYSPKATTFTASDVMTSLSGGFNISSESLEIGVPDTTKGGDFFFGLIKFGEPNDREALHNYVLDRFSPEIREDDLVILIVGDSTGDDISSTDSEMTDEMFRRWAEEELPTEYPDATIYYRTWARTGDVYTGWELMATGAGDDRVFVSNASVSGSQPSYGMAERFGDMYGSLPHVDEIIGNHGHNLPVSTTDTNGLLRLGEWLDAMDKLRIHFPDAPQMWIRTHPHRTNETMAPVVAALDNAAALYGDVELVDIYDHFDSNGRPVGWYLGDNVHPSVPDGVDEQLSVFAPAYAGWVRPTSIAPALILTTGTNLLANGDFSSFTGAAPDSWTLAGSGGSVSLSTDVVDRGQDHSVKIEQSSGNGRLEQTISAVPYQGQTLVLAVRQYIVDGGSVTSGRISLITNGTGAVDPSAWNYDSSNQSVDGWRWAYIHVPVPNDATTITVRLYAAGADAGEVYYGRAVLVAGEEPRDIA